MKDRDRRTVVWFSAGAASAVAAKLTLANPPTDEVVVAYVDPGSEHPDAQRFITDCEHWLGSPVLRLRSEKYRDTWDVFAQRRFLVGPTGALCTVELKKKVRQAFERRDDLQVFGYTVEEARRADRFRDQNPGVELLTPLIDAQLTKADCHAIIDRAGIEPHAMYRLGYRNANCVGCVKGGAGYWNRIRRDFPDVFDRMAAVEDDLGRTILREADGTPIPLRTLDADRGDQSTDADFECSLFCHVAEERLDADR